MIKRLYIDNYKSLVNFELRLQGLTLLLGPNGVGKTSVLDVILTLHVTQGGSKERTRPCSDVFPLDQFFPPRLDVLDEIEKPPGVLNTGAI